MLLHACSCIWSSLTCVSTCLSSMIHFPDGPIFKKPQVIGPAGSPSEKPNCLADKETPASSVPPVFASFNRSPMTFVNCCMICQALTVESLSPQNHMSSCIRYKFDSVDLFTAKSRQKSTASPRASLSRCCMGTPLRLTFAWPSTPSKGYSAAFVWPVYP